MKYKIESKTLFFTLLVLYLFFILLTFFPSYDFEKNVLSPIFIFSSIFLLICFAIYYLLEFFQHYYLVKKKTLIIKKVFSKTEIPFNDIIYIDEKNIKKGVFKIYLKSHNYLTLVVDKDNKLIPILKKNCKNLVLYEDLSNK